MDEGRGDREREGSLAVVAGGGAKGKRERASGELGEGGQQAPRRVSFCGWGWASLSCEGLVHRAVGALRGLQGIRSVGWARTRDGAGQGLVERAIRCGVMRLPRIGGNREVIADWQAKIEF